MTETPPYHPHHSALPRPVKYLMLATISVVLVLVGVEYFLARYYPQKTIDLVQSISFKCFEEGQHRWVKLRKNARCPLISLYNSFPPVDVVTNSMGMRNPEIPLEKPPGTKRVLFIGDSFTMGWGVREEDGYVRLTEGLLNHATASSSIQAINAGFTAAGPSGYYLSLQLDGLSLDPDIVVVGLFLGNDITSRTDVEWVKQDNQGLPTVVRSKSTYIDPTGQLRLKDLPPAYHVPHLRKLNTFILLMNVLYPNAVIPNQDRLIAETICVFNRDCHDLDQAKSEVKLLLDTMNDELKGMGKKFVVVLIPTHFLVHFDIGYKTKYNLPVLPSERRYLEDEFIDYFNHQGIDYVDLLPPLLAVAGNTRLYFTHDDHWNEAGHRVAAEAIAQKLAPMLK